MAAERMSQLRALQVGNAKKVAAALGQIAAERQVTGWALWAMILGGLTTINAESTFMRYGNDGTYAGEQRKQVWAWYGGQEAYRRHMRLSLAQEPDIVGGGAETTKDSIGLFQQREMYGYAGLGRVPHPDGPARLMSIEWTTRVWAVGTGTPDGPSRWWLHPKVPQELTGHDDLSVAKRCQWVQGSEFPDGGNYLEAIPAAKELMVAFHLPVPATDWFTECFRGESA